MKFSKARPAENGQKQQIDIAIPTFGYKNHISINRRHGVIRKSLVTDAAAHDGARLREGLIDPSNTASDVWADSACLSAENERFLKGASKTSRIHRIEAVNRNDPVNRFPPKAERPGHPGKNPQGKRGQISGPLPC